MNHIKLTTWNVNSIRIRMEALSFLTKTYEPDVVCLQEVKAKEDWEKRRKEIYKTAVELQYGVQPPKPEVLEYEYLTEVKKDLDCIKIYAGTKERQVSFLMNIYKPSKYNGKYP